MRVKISTARAGLHGQLEVFHANIGLLAAHLQRFSGGTYLVDLMLGKYIAFWDGWVVSLCLVLSTLAGGLVVAGQMV